MKTRAASLAARTPHVRGVVNREVIVQFDLVRLPHGDSAARQTSISRLAHGEQEEQSRRISARAIASRERRRRRASIETPVDGASEDAASWSYCQPALGDKFRRRDRWPCLGHGRFSHGVGPGERCCGSRFGVPAAR